MSAGHDHGHGDGGHDHGPPSRRESDRRRLGLTLALAAVYMVAEVVGGLLTGSLALLADAGHMLSDVSALALGLFALWFAERPSGRQSTYGHLRAEILAALANGVALVVIAVLIVVEAVERLGAPPAVQGLPMLAVATGGLVVNLAGLRILGGGHEHSLNVRGAWLHVLADTLGSVGAMASGLAVWAFGWTIADPLASIAIAVLVVLSAWALLRDTVDVLMEKAPRHLDVRKVERTIAAVAGVGAVHDLHVWTVTSGMVALSCHVTLSGDRGHEAVLAAVQGAVRDGFSIEHVTVQLEAPSVPACEPCD